MTEVLGDKNLGEMMLEIGSGFRSQRTPCEIACSNTSCRIVFSDNTIGEIVGDGKNMEASLEKARGGIVEVIGSGPTHIFSLQILTTPQEST